MTSTPGMGRPIEPGFTTGLAYPELLERLCQIALDRQAAERNLRF